MTYDDKTLDFLEQAIPLCAAGAGKIAYWNALIAGNSVVIARDGALIEIFPDGSEKFIKSIPPPMKVETGTIQRPQE